MELQLRLRELLARHAPFVAMKRSARSRRPLSRDAAATAIEENVMTRMTSTCFALVLGPLLAAAFATPSWAEEQAYVRSASDQALQWGACPDFMPQGCEIAVLHGDPAEPNADIFFRVPGGAEIARHWHNSPERMVLVSGELDVTYDGQEPVTLTSGTYAYGPARKPHSATCRSSDPCTLFIAFVEPVDAMEGAPQ